MGVNAEIYRCFSLENNGYVVGNNFDFSIKHICPGQLQYSVKDDLGNYHNNFILEINDEININIDLPKKELYYFDSLFIDNGVERVIVPVLVINRVKDDKDININFVDGKLELMLFNYGSPKELDLNYYIYNDNGDLYGSFSDVIFVQDQKLFYKDLNLRGGDYFIVARIDNLVEAVYITVPMNEDFNFQFYLILSGFFIFGFIMWFVLRRPRVVKELNRRHRFELKGYIKKGYDKDRKELLNMKKDILRMIKSGYKRMDIKKKCLSKYNKDIVEDIFNRLK